MLDWFKRGFREGDRVVVRGEERYGKVLHVCDGWCCGWNDARKRVFVQWSANRLSSWMYPVDLKRVKR